MRTLIVLEEIENATFFHQARNEVESGLAILHDVLALRIAALRAILKILKTEKIKNLFDDIRNIFLLKDAAIRSAREKPEPRYDFRAIVAERNVASQARKATDEAVPVALLVVGGGNGDGDALADDILERHGVVFRQKVGIEVEQPRNSFMAGEILQKENVLSEGRVDRQEPVRLGVWHFWFPL